MGRPGKLTPEQVVEIREAYEHQRDLTDNDPDYAETVATTEARLAGRFGISASMVRRIVLGLSYAALPGPIDAARRAVAKEVLDETPPTAVRLTVSRPGLSALSFVYPPGTTVLVEPIAEDPGKYNATGKRAEASPTSKTKAAPKTKTKTKVRPRRSRSATAPEEYQPDSAAPSSGFASTVLAGE